MPDAEDLIDSDQLIRALDVLRERRDDAIAVLEEELDEVRYVMVETASELDDQLAEFRFDLVEQNIDTAISTIQHIDEEKLEELARLNSIRIDEEASSGSDNPDTRAPVLDKRELPNPDPEKWDQLKAQDDFVDIVQRNVDTCSNQIHRILDYFTYDLWPFTVGEAQVGSTRGVDAALAVFRDVAGALRDAFDLWMLWLNELYQYNSSYLGEGGDSVDARISWLSTQGRAEPALQIAAHAITRTWPSDQGVGVRIASKGIDTSELGKNRCVM